MRYTVVWLSSALNDLTAIWTDAYDRQAVSDAADGIEQILRIDPILRGETVKGSLRVLLREPLEVIYRVIEDDQTVQVVGLRRIVLSDDED